MPNKYECTKCEKEFASMSDYLNPKKHLCVIKSDKVPKPRPKKS